MGYCGKHERFYEAASCGMCGAEDRAGFEQFLCTCGRAGPVMGSVRVFDVASQKIVRRCDECAARPPHPEHHQLTRPAGSGDVAFLALYRFSPLPEQLDLAYCSACDQALYRDSQVWRPMSWGRLADLWERDGRHQQRPL